MDTIWEKIVPAALGLIAGAVGSIIAPWVNWSIELKRQKLQHKKDTIAKWRAMLADAARQSAERGEPLQKFIESSADFYSLREHLSPDTIAGLFFRTFVAHLIGPLSMAL